MSWHRRMLAAATVAAALSISALWVAPAQPSARNGTYFYMVMYRGGRASGPVESEMTLTCFPEGGNHPDPGGACMALREVGGDFGRLKIAHADCTMEYSPVTIKVLGKWRDQRIKFIRIYPNRCLVAAMSDWVLNFP
ncbi:SSI family serine proteinase inhibitor [Streptomyces sp. NBRC 110611]|uniref:SSI family serine proteinase inhibitor n=1 Tax=Streptomyces sp. NBRC 110611 TaxID=1621259 RepID=UPI0009A08F68